MKRYILSIILITLSLNIFAQKEVRKNIKKGNKAYRDQRYSVAEDNYKNALELSEADADALYNLANAYYRQQKWDDAIKTYEGVLKIEKDNELKSKTFSNMGNAFLKKESEKSNQQGNQMPNMMPQAGVAAPGAMPMPNQQQAQGEKQEDYLQKAIEAYKSSLRLNPTDDETRSNLAIAQKLVKDNDDDGGGGDDSNQDQNQDQNKDQNQDQQDQDKDKQDEDKNQDKQNQQDQNKEEQNQGKISRENMQQILEAMEQDEKQTQEKVNKMKADAKKEKAQKNKEQDKDW